MSRPLPQQAHTRPVHEALDASHALGRLMERLKESEARMAVIQPALPPAMRPWVKTGVLDEEGWSLMVPNAAVAAKLRHSLPHLEALLLEAGWPRLPLRVKVQGGRG